MECSLKKNSTHRPSRVKLTQQSISIETRTKLQDKRSGWDFKKKNQYVHNLIVASNTWDSLDFFLSKLFRENKVTENCYNITLYNKSYLLLLQYLPWSNAVETWWMDCTKEAQGNLSIVKVITKQISVIKLNSVALVRTRTIPTERPPPVGEVSANFCG